MAKTWAVILLGIVLVAQLAPIWWFRHFATQDGPSHVGNSLILRDLLLGRERPGYAINSRPVPNWTSHLLLAGLNTVFSAEVSEKLVLTACVLILPLAGMYAAGALAPASRWCAILFVPLASSLALHKGLYNFCLGLGLFLVLVGWAIRNAPRGRPLDLLGLGALSLLLYFTHIVPLIMALLVLAALAPAIGRRSVRSALALLPAALLALSFIVTSPGSPWDRRPIGIQVLRFFELDSLVSLRKPELLLAIGYSVVLWVAAGWLAIVKLRGKCWTRTDALLLIAGLCLGVYLAAPNSAAGGGQLSFRLALFPYLLLILWLGGASNSQARVALAKVAAAFAVTFVVVRWPAYAQMDRALRDYTSVATALEPGRTMMAVDLSRGSPSARAMAWRIQPFWHAAARIAGERGLLDWGNYEASTGYFPVVFSKRAPASHRISGDTVSDDERSAIAAQPDYIVLWSLDASRIGPGAALRAMLERDYRLIATSPAGNVGVWKRWETGFRVEVW